MHIRHPLDIGAMRRAASELVGTHDFAAYAKAGGRPGPTTVRNLYRLSLRSLANGTVVLTLTANGFLRSMVRNIVGTLIEIGKGDLPYQAAGEILETRSRALNPCAPAAPQGLCLWRVDYKLGPTRPLAAASAGCMIDNGED
jgi:tRNA pseudouridine38-40 synthase